MDNGYLFCSCQTTFNCIQNINATKCHNSIDKINNFNSRLVINYIIIYN